MPRPLAKIGNREKALIHVAKAQLGMSDEDYRAMLAGVGVKSSTELNPVQCDELMRRFKGMGFVPAISGGAARSRRRRPRVAEQREPLMGKIEAIILDTGLTWAYADGIARKMFGIDSVRFCDETQLWKIVAALSVHIKRQAKKEEGLK